MASNSSWAPRQRETPSVTPEEPLLNVTTPKEAIPSATRNKTNTNITPSDAQTPEGKKTITERPCNTSEKGNLTSSKVAVASQDSESELLQEEDRQLLYHDMDACFKAFDKDEDGFLSENEFGALCRALFRNERGKPYPVESTMLNHIFTIFDTNKDHVIDKEEFRFCWQKWIKQVVRPVTALLVVDVQNDFITGSLSISNCPAGQNGEDVLDHQSETLFEQVIAPINRLLEEVKFDMVVYSLDWHPEDHVSFINNISQRTLHETNKVNIDEAQVYDTVIFDVKNDGNPMEQKLWPRHCVQNTWGAELHQDLKMAEEAVLIYKGTSPDTDSYSAFWDNNKTSHTNLNEELQKKNVTDVFVCGIATDVCVASTTAHAMEEGYRTMLIHDASRGVSEEDIKATFDKVVAGNGLVIQSSQVKSLASGRDRPPVLAYRLALELAKQMKKK